jgi:hypothetical protein
MISASTPALYAKACMWAMTPSGGLVSVGGSSVSCDRWSACSRSSNASTSGYWHGRANLSQNEIAQYTRRRIDANGDDRPRAWFCTRHCRSVHQHVSPIAKSVGACDEYLVTVRRLDTDENLRNF